MVTTQQNQVQIQAQQNAMARQYLLKTGVPMRKHVGTFGPYNLAQAIQIQLLNVGVLTSVDLVVTAEITITGAATASNWGPYNFLQNIGMVDYTTQKRINVSHRALQMFLSARHSRRYGLGTKDNIIDSTLTTSTNAPLIQLPSAIVAPTAANFRVSAHLPIAYDSANNLKGAILAQTILGNQFVTALMPTAAQVFGTTDDAVFTAGAGSVANIFVDVFQNYIQPRNIGSQPILPLADLATVYELNTQGRDNSNLNPNNIKYVNYPNVREIISTVLGYNNGSTVAGAALTYAADLTSLAVEANSNTKLREYLGLDLLEQQRNLFGGDMPPGYYYLDSRRVRINTVLYGQVQLLMLPSIVTVPAAAYTEFSTESFYLKGTALPGISTGA